MPELVDQRILLVKWGSCRMVGALRGWWLVIAEGKKNVPPETSTASPIHCGCQPAGQWNSTVRNSRTQLACLFFLSGNVDSVW